MVMIRIALSLISNERFHCCFLVRGIGLKAWLVNFLLHHLYIFVHVPEIIG